MCSSSLLILITSQVTSRVKHEVVLETWHYFYVATHFFIMMYYHFGFYDTMEVMISSQECENQMEVSLYEKICTFTVILVYEITTCQQFDYYTGDWTTFGQTKILEKGGIHQMQFCFGVHYMHLQCLLPHTYLYLFLLRFSLFEC